MCCVSLKAFGSLAQLMRQATLNSKIDDLHEAHNQLWTLGMRMRTPLGQLAYAQLLGHGMLPPHRSLSHVCHRPLDPWEHNYIGHTGLSTYSHNYIDRNYHNYIGHTGMSTYSHKYIGHNYIQVCQPAADHDRHQPFVCGPRKLAAPCRAGLGAPWLNSRGIWHNRGGLWHGVWHGRWRMADGIYGRWRMADGIQSSRGKWDRLSVVEKIPIAEGAP